MQARSCTFAIQCKLNANVKRRSQVAMCFASIDANFWRLLWAGICEGASALAEQLRVCTGLTSISMEFLQNILASKPISMNIQKQLQISLNTADK